MHRVLRSGFPPALLLFVLFFFTSPLWVSLQASVEAAWKNKPIAQWSVEDAKQLLAESPWTKLATAALLPQKNEDQLREGGQMGGGKGVGLQAIDQSILTGIGGPPKGTKLSKTSGSQKLTVRWESALPVRTAELKVGETQAPDWDGDYYVIAIYGVPGVMANPNQKNLAAELKRMATLKLDDQWELKPVRVDVVPMGSASATVVYLFPRTEEISTRSKLITFVAQINRLFISQYFVPGEMILAGKIEV